ncbi:MAG: SDR family NAD(P)-dependent oxidoreductase [Anaerolineales bacterium]
MQNESREIQGRRILITGGTAGIGRAAALELAKRQASVLIVGRNEKRGLKAVEQMRRSAPDQEFDFLKFDLLTMSGTRRLAEAVKERFNILDVLINNAGGFFLTRQLTSEGHERTFALNHLSPFLLTHLLLENLDRSEDPRIITTSSGSHRRGEIHFDNLQLSDGYSGLKAYSQSKLANVLFTYELDRRLSDRFAANSFHPGFVATNIGLVHPLITPLMKLYYIFRGRSPEEGAATALHLAAHPEGAQISGRYWFDEEPVETSPNSYDRDTWRRLWEVSEKLVVLEPALRIPAPDSD